MQRHHSKGAALVAAAALGLLAATSLSVAAQAQTYSYTALNAPGSTNTAPRDINNIGTVTGRSGANSSYVESGGVYTNVSIPGSTRVVARGINESGTVVGFYKPSGPAGQQAFIQSSGGLMTFSFAGADATQALGVNDVGAFVGTYSLGGVQHAFQYVGGAASEIVVAGATSTQATGINNAGDIVGYYTNAASETLGFLSHDNVITSFSVPGASFTAALGINNSGDIVGSYIPATSSDELAFVRLGNLYTLLDVPESVFANATVTNATGINDAGAIVGYAGLSGTNFNNGFLATPIAGAPLKIALDGGGADAPVALPISKIGSVSGAIGGGVASQFYSFDWAGGTFGATLSLTNGDAAISYGFQLCSGPSCGTILDSATLKSGQWTGTLTDDLAAGTYTIGLIEHEPGVDPYFTLSFLSPVSSAAPEPAAWTLFLVGFGLVSGSARVRLARRRWSPPMQEFGRGVGDLRTTRTFGQHQAACRSRGTWSDRRA